MSVWRRTLRPTTGGEAPVLQGDGRQSGATPQPASPRPATPVCLGEASGNCLAPVSLSGAGWGAPLYRRCMGLQSRETHRCEAALPGCRWQAGLEEQTRVTLCPRSPRPRDALRKKREGKEAEANDDNACGVSCAGRSVGQLSAQAAPGRHSSGLICPFLWELCQ